MRRDTICGVFLSVGVGLGVGATEPEPEAGRIGWADGTLTLALPGDRVAVSADGAALRLTWRGGSASSDPRQDDFDPRLRGVAPGAVRALRAEHTLVVEGGWRTAEPLDLQAPRIEVRGWLEVEALAASSGELLDVAAGARVVARQGVSLRGDCIAISGEVHAPGDGADVDVRARAVLQGGAVTAGGAVTLAVQRYIGTQAARIQAAHVRLEAAEHLFTSATFRAPCIDVLGPGVLKLVSATLDACGGEGGRIHVGGGARGRDPERPNAREVQLTRHTHLLAAGADGAGGSVVVWSEERTLLAAAIDVSAGARGGAGSVEVSSRGELAYAGTVEASSATGAPARLLLDPHDLVIDDAAGAFPSFEVLDPNPDNGGFGRHLYALGGDLYAADADDDFAASNAGAAYLFDGRTFALLCALTGASAADRVGDSAPTVLAGGSAVVPCQSWDAAGAPDAGAATWLDAAPGTTGVVSAANSLVGSRQDDRVGFQVTALANGHYAVASPNWDDGARQNVGAVTWGDGASGVVGPVSPANSLYGTSAFDLVGLSRVIPLPGGDYVVCSNLWDGGAVNVGAATWCDGSGPVAGAVSAANSLTGSSAEDQVGSGGAVVLAGGDYVVLSQFWNHTAADVGAVTWCDGAGPTVAVVSASNSLVGAAADDRVGGSGVMALTNGHYVVRSASWDGAGTDRGAATWGDGTTGVTGVVSTANSVVGASDGDQVGRDAQALTNGHYVLQTQNWGPSDVGAVTWCDGTGPTADVVGAGNSLVGASSGDRVGQFLTALEGGNYVVGSPDWDGAALNVGAATWCDGSGPTIGVVSPANSLVGSSLSDQVGERIPDLLT